MVIMVIMVMMKKRTNTMTNIMTNHMTVIMDLGHKTPNNIPMMT